MKLPDYGFGVLFVVWCACMIIAPVAADPVYYDGNGHYYEKIIEPGITWSEANSAAQSMTYEGVQGHLATINSEDENTFIKPMIWTGLEWRYYWIGGFQPAGSTEPDGGWQWVTGEPWSYTNWYGGGEPDNLDGAEDKLAIFYCVGDADHGGGGKGWRDFRNDEAVQGYIVEWEATPTVEDLITKIDQLDLPNGIEQGFVAKLNVAEMKIAQQHYTPARNTLSAFIKQVNAQRGKTLSDTQAEELISIAQQIINSIPGK